MHMYLNMNCGMGTQPIVLKLLFSTESLSDIVTIQFSYFTFCVNSISNHACYTFSHNIEPIIGPMYSYQVMRCILKW